MPVEEDFIGAVEAARLAGTSVRLIQHHAKRKNLPGRLIGRYWLFRRADVEGWTAPKPGRPRKAKGGAS